MATGGSFTGSFVGSNDDNQENQQNASAEAEDSLRIKYPCNPCKRNKTVKEALHYCPTCKEFYCDTCLHFHKIMALSKDHVVYKWDQRKISSNLKEKCQQHPSEPVTMVCESCKELCCHVCISSKHRKCHSTQCLQTAAKGIRDSSRKQDILDKIQETSKYALKQKTKLDASLEDINTKQASVLKQINDTRKQVDKTFNKMEKNVNTQGKSLREKVSEEIKDINTLRLDMNSLRKNLLNTSNRDECEVFMDVIQAENRVDRAEGEINEDKIEQTIKDIKEPDFNTYQLRLQTQLSYRYPVTKDNCHAACVHCFHHKKHYHGNIAGICQLSDGTFILADSVSFQLIWLSQSYKVIEKIDLKEVPSAVCNTDSDNVAVSLNYKLHVFCYMTHEPLKDVSFSHGCCGLAYNDNTYYISDHKSTVYMYDINGTNQKVIGSRSDTLPRPLFQSVRNIAIGKEAKKVYVTDIEKGLITMDLDGNVLSNLETNDTKGAYGVCVNNAGNVLVTNYLQDRVIEVDKDGKTILQTNIITIPKGQSPRAICFDFNNSNILLSENPIGGSNMLLVISRQINKIS